MCHHVTLMRKISFPRFLNIVCSGEEGNHTRLVIKSQCFIIASSTWIKEGYFLSAIEERIVAFLYKIIRDLPLHTFGDICLSDLGPLIPVHDY